VIDAENWSLRPISFAFGNRAGAGNGRSFSVSFEIRTSPSV
jgi:hypothetical protein